MRTGHRWFPPRASASSSRACSPPLDCPSAAAATVARGLVEADLEGLPSHGVMLVDMYIDRLLKGSVSRNETASVISERQGAVVLDAGHALGQLTGIRAMTIAVDKARRFAAGVVSVRHGFHFGTAGRYARQAAEAGLHRYRDVQHAPVNAGARRRRTRRRQQSDRDRGTNRRRRFQSCSTWRQAKPRWERSAWRRRPKKLSPRHGR